jgi:hypothetical protein
MTPINRFSLSLTRLKMALLNAAAATYSSAQIILAIAYNVFFSTGIMFLETYCNWQCHPLLEQTWATLKVDFALAHQELRNSQVTSNQVVIRQQTTRMLPVNAASYNIQ